MASKEYKIEFEVTERSLYWTSVEAESPEEALRLWKEDPCIYDAEADCTIESDDLVDTAECVGEWVDFIDDEKYKSSSLKRYNEPIKLK